MSLEYKDRRDEYLEFVRGSVWKSQRSTRIKIDGNRCVSCGSKCNLEVHHKIYRKNLESCDIEKDLITLCHSCHEKIEQVKRTCNERYIKMRGDMYPSVKCALQSALIDNSIKYWNMTESITADAFNYVIGMRKNMPYGDHSKVMSAVVSALGFEPFSEFIKGLFYYADIVPVELKKKAGAATRARISRGEVEVGKFNTQDEVRNFVKTFIGK